MIKYVIVTLAAGGLGAGIGFLAGGPIGAAIGAGVGLGVGIIYCVYQEVRSRRAIAEAEATLALEEGEQATELVGLLIEQEEEKATDTTRIQQQVREIEEDKKAVGKRERKIEEEVYKNKEQEKIIDQKHIKREQLTTFIDDEIVKLGVQRMKVVRGAVDLLLKVPGITLATIQSHVKESFPDIELFFEDELRDPKTDALMEDCVKAPDGYYYNRSTLEALYKQAQEEKRPPVCFNDPSKPLPNPATLPTDHAMQAKTQRFQQAGLSEALSLFSTKPTSIQSEEYVSNDPLVKKVVTSQKQTFLNMKEGYSALFFPRQKPVQSSSGKKPHELDVGIVVGRHATLRAS